MLRDRCAASLEVRVASAVCMSIEGRTVVENSLIISTSLKARSESIDAMGDRLTI